MMRAIAVLVAVLGTAVLAALVLLGIDTVSSLAALMGDAAAASPAIGWRGPLIVVLSAALMAMIVAVLAHRLLDAVLGLLEAAPERGPRADGISAPPARSGAEDEEETPW